MRGDKRLINGDQWVIVDIAPAPELADMVAVILEEENFPVIVRGADGNSDVFSHMGTSSLGTTFVLVPEDRAQAALDLIAETVTDYEGDDIDELLEQLALEGEVVNGLEDEAN